MPTMAYGFLLLTRQQRRICLRSPCNSLFRSLSFTPWALQQGAQRLLEAFERYGHHEADTDPLGLTSIQDRPELDPLIYFPPDATLNTSLGPSSLPSSTPSSMPIGTIETYTHRLRAIFCGGVGFEYAHLDDGREREWLRERIHQLFLPPPSSVLSPAYRINAAALMMQAQAFEEFLATKHPSFKAPRPCSLVSTSSSVRRLVAASETL
ncbi:mfs transporter, partial [Nannochloropsis oceanica]